MIKVGIADYGVNQWEGALYDYRDRLTMLKEIGFDGIERVEAKDAAEAIEIVADARQMGMDFATCRTNTPRQNIRFTAALGLKYLWSEGSFGNNMELYTRRVNCQIEAAKKYGYEDNFVMVRLVDSAKKVVFDMQPKYHFIRRDGSITASPYHSGLHDQIDAARENYDYISGKYPVLADMAWRRLVNAHFSVLFVLFSSNGKPDPEKRDACIGFLKENRRKIWAEPRIKRIKKLFLLALSIHPTLCKLLVQFSRYIQVLRNDTP